jgi:signal transduction histidine kinase
MIRIKSIFQGKKGKIALMIVLLAAACFFTYYNHVVLKKGTVFTHLFYIPITLAGLWWRRKGIIVAIFLSMALLLSHIFFRQNVETINDYLRLPMFLMVGFIVAVISEKNVKAEKQLLEHRERLRSLASKLNFTEEQQRRRIASELHNGIGQILALCKRKVDKLKKSVSSDKNAQSLEEIREIITQSIKSTRSLTFELCPTTLYDLGFEAAVESLLMSIEKEHEITCEFEKNGFTEPGTKDSAVILFRAVEELLHNVIKHSRASNAKISVNENDENIWVTVEDNGSGFDLSQLSADESRNSGFGLFNLRERISSLDGEVNIESQPGNGTHISIKVPRNHKTK